MLKVFRTSPSIENKPVICTLQTQNNHSYKKVNTCTCIYEINILSEVIRSSNG